MDLVHSKETTLERADFTLQMLMLVNLEEERELFSFQFLSAVVPSILEHGQTMKAQTNRPRGQLILI